MSGYRPLCQEKLFGEVENHESLGQWNAENLSSAEGSWACEGVPNLPLTVIQSGEAVAFSPRTAVYALRDSPAWYSAWAVALGDLLARVALR